jgi:hypothetical protein
MGVGKCQTAAATPAEPGDLPRWVSADSFLGRENLITGHIQELLPWYLQHIELNGFRRF